MEKNLVATELVDRRFACPHCGEQRMDWLVWDSEGVEVDCETCGMAYEPHVDQEDGSGCSPHRADEALEALERQRAEDL